MGGREGALVGPERSRGGGAEGLELAAAGVGAVAGGGDGDGGQLEEEEEEQVCGRRGEERHPARALRRHGWRVGEAAGLAWLKPE